MLHVRLEGDRVRVGEYSFPKEWTLDGMTFSTNRELSATDKSFIAARYPKRRQHDAA